MSIKNFLLVGKLRFATLGLFVFLNLIWPMPITPAQAASPATIPTDRHFTLIINQVRGAECCSPGGVSELQQQLDALQTAPLPATWVVRYDALQGTQFTSWLKKLPSTHEIGAFLEITPQLAADAGVTYQATDENWYEAQHVYLIGYQPTDRQRLIDQYMAEFKRVFGYYPQTTTAWIIDTPSLQYLSQKYQIRAHQITREQWGTDSYTLWGGPPHHPYWPSPQWAFTPVARLTETATPVTSVSPVTTNMPVMLRQTITDPLHNYGDDTSSYTSQPNDYGQQNRGLDYFRHLLQTAHQQPTTTTFALIGLENSMPQKDQLEFARQVEVVGNWALTAGNAVVTARQYAALAMAHPAMIAPPMSVYHGQDYKNGSSQQAWWITTPRYRARLRLDAGELALTDLRVYDARWLDPYASSSATRSAYWIQPFLVDGARYRLGGTHHSFLQGVNDKLRDRITEKYGEPSRLILQTAVDPQNLQLQTEAERVSLNLAGQRVVEFTPEKIWLINSDNLKQHPVLNTLVQNWTWRDEQNQALWQLVRTPDDPQLFAVHTAAEPTQLAQQRERQYPHLFPELRPRPVDVARSELRVTNYYAQAGRNPVRLAFFPRDQFEHPALIDTLPTVNASGSAQGVIDVTQTQPDGQDGLVLIDLWSTRAQAASVELRWHELHKTAVVYFVPNCKQELVRCLREPVQAWRYVRNWVGDQWRAWERREKGQ